MDTSNRNRMARAALAIALSLGSAQAFAAADYKIVTANEKGTYFAIGNDLAKYVAPDADISLEVLPSAGSAANIKHLRYDPGVKFAVVQADVYQAYLDRALAKNAEAANLIRPMRVILPLYSTEIHFIVRADSPINYLHEIKDAKINGGIVGSGAALITHTLYRQMFGGAMPEAQASWLSNEEALVKLIGDKSVDVVTVAAGQPAPLISNMKPEAQKYIKLLKFDPDHPSSKQPLTIYSASTIQAKSYPHLLKEDFTTVGVGAYLVTYDFNLGDTVSHLTRFARSLCANFPTLQEKGHPKWKEVGLELAKLPPGWSYYGPTARELRQCAAKMKAVAPAPARAPGKACSPEEKVLGFCG